MKKIFAIIFALLFSLSCFLLVRLALINTAGTIDPEFATIVFDSEIEKRNFKFEEFSTLYFLNDHDPLTKFSKKTRILGSTPNLNIINSEDYRVEVTANSDVFEKLKIGQKDDTLVITLSDDCYVPVHVDDHEYAYDTGLYATFGMFEVTVYAPIDTLAVDSTVSLDYQAPKCEKTYIRFSFDGTEAKIYDIDTKNLELYCKGDSHLNISGNVENSAKIMALHNTQVDASELTSKYTDFFVSSYVLGNSYIKYDHIYFTPETTGNLFVFTYIYFPPVLWLFCLIICLRKKKRAT